MGNSKYAVFVHNLPSDCERDALALFPNEHIEKVKHDGVGLRIYFTNYDSAKECILRRNIRVQGTSYMICPLLTNLTLSNIRQHASKSTIEDLMTQYGPVIESYPVEIITKKARAVTNDYRVILDIPEVQVDFELSPLHLPHRRDRTFNVSFFCRICRRDGHMQWQCSADHCISQQEEAIQNKCRPERQDACPEVRCSKNSKDRVRCSSNQQDKVQVSNEMTSFEIDLVKRRKERRNSDDRPNGRFGNNHSEITNEHETDSISLESNNKGYYERYLRHDHATEVNGLNTNVVKQSAMVSEIQCSSFKQLDADFTSQTSIVTDPSNEEFGCDKSGQEGIKPPHKRKTTKRSNLSERSDGNMWSRIIPPNVHHKNAKKLLLAVYKTQLVLEEPIPQKVEWKLREILKWNQGRDKKELDKKDRNFIMWLEKYLDRVSRQRIQSGKSEGEKKVYQPQNAKDDQTSGEVEKEIKSKRQRVLCPGIEKIVLKTQGVLIPVLLRNFLNQVRGRRNQMKIATEFTEDIPALCDQLGEVKRLYYLIGKRGTTEDGDISFIKQLSQRLMQSNTAKEEPCILNDQPNFKKQPSTKRSLPQNSKSKSRKNVKYGSQDEAQKSSPQTDTAAYPVELMKCSSRKNLPSCGQPSRIPRSSTESCPKKYTEEKTKANSSHEEQWFRSSSSSKYFSTEKELHERSERVGGSNVPVKNRSRRIMASRKPPSCRDGPDRKIKRNYSFYNRRSSSEFGHSTDNDSHGNSAWNVEWDLSNRGSSYTTQSNTDDDSFQQSCQHFQQSLPFENPTTELSNLRKQSNVFPEITKSDSRQIMSRVQQSNAAEKFPDITKSYLRKILSYVHQSHENASFD